MRIAGGRLAAVATVQTQTTGQQLDDQQQHFNRRHHGGGYVLVFAQHLLDVFYRGFNVDGINCHATSCRHDRG